MKTYSVLYAEDVPHYGTAEIEAENDAEAIAKAKAGPIRYATTRTRTTRSASASFTSRTPRANLSPPICPSMTTC